MVAVNLFNSFCQREDVPVQDYSIDIEHLFYRAYPGTEPETSIFLMDKFITGLVSPQIKEKLRTPPLPATFREAVNSAMAFTAAIFPEHQTLRQRSLAWKMAASNGHPLSRSPHSNPKGSIQVIDSSAEDANIQAIRQWCALHKTDKHSDSNCRAQQESAQSNVAKKRPTGAKKPTKPRRIRFESTSDKKKFLRSIEEMEGVSLEQNSDDDDSDVVEQSLMQLYADSSSEESDGNEHHSNLHVLVLTPGNMLGEEDVIMTEAEAPNAPAGNQLVPTANSQNSSPMSQLKTDTNVSLRETVEPSIHSPGFPSDFAALSPSDIALLDDPNPQPSDSSIKIPKVEENPFSPDPIEMDTDMFPPLPTVDTPAPPQPTAPLPNGPIRVGGVYYHLVPAPHNEVVSTSSVAAPNLVAVNQGTAPSAPAPPVDKPKMGLEFVMPEQPPAKRTSRRSRSRSRSSSRNRNAAAKADSQIPQTSAQQTNVRTSRGRGKKKMPTTPIQVPPSHSHLMNKSKPKEGLRISFASDAHERKVENTVQHLAKLSTEASAPLIITSKPTKETTVPPEPPILAQEDSDVDLETGEISIPTLPTNESF